MENFSLLRLILLLTVVVYYIFEYFDEKQIVDEREKLIQLKTYELVHKVTTTALLFVAVAYLLIPTMNALFPVLVLVFAFLYTEIIGKIYYRKKF